MLTNLMLLFFGTNLIEGTIPTELGLLTELTTLDLRGNRFNGAVPTQSAYWCYSGSDAITYLTLFLKSIDWNNPYRVWEYDRLDKI